MAESCPDLCLTFYRNGSGYLESQFKTHSFALFLGVFKEAALECIDVLLD
jgi:hypothetical protein